MSEDKKVSDLTAEERRQKALQEEKEAAEKLKTARLAAEAAAEEEYQAAASEVKITDIPQLFTNKRGQEQIFRRELGEPEFWLDKGNRGPPRPILTQDEEKEISRKVEIPMDQTPRYEPKHVLSQEFEGLSNYEKGIEVIQQETKEKLNRLKNDPNSSLAEIKEVEIALKELDCLYENYYVGMNVFRTAKGGRDKLRK